MSQLIQASFAGSQFPLYVMWSTIQEESSVPVTERHIPGGDNTFIDVGRPLLHRILVLELSFPSAAEYEALRRLLYRSGLLVYQELPAPGTYAEFKGLSPARPSGDDTENVIATARFLLD